MFDFIKERALRAIILLAPDEGMTADQCGERRLTGFARRPKELTF